MSDYPPQKAIDNDGWTDWVLPVMDSYKMQCCDCGLKHEFQFKVGTESERDGDEFTFEPLQGNYRVAMKGRRIDANQ